MIMVIVDRGIKHGKSHKCPLVCEIISIGSRRQLEGLLCKGKDNLIFARLMDAGKLLKAKVSTITKKGSFTQIGVGIYLVDL